MVGFNGLHSFSCGQNCESKLGNGASNGVERLLKASDHDGKNENEEVQEESEQDKEWDRFITKKNGSNEKDFTFERFLQCQGNWNDAHGKLQAAYDDFEEKMGGKISELINLFHAIYKQKQAKLDELGAECKRYLLENHRQRNEIVHVLHEANEKWKSNYQILVARALDEEEPVVVDGINDGSGEVG